MYEPNQTQVGTKPNPGWYQTKPRYEPNQTQVGLNQDIDQRRLSMTYCNIVIIIFLILIVELGRPTDIDLVDFKSLVCRQRWVPKLILY